VAVPTNVPADLGGCQLMISSKSTIPQGEEDGIEGALLSRRFLTTSCWLRATVP